MPLTGEAPGDRVGLADGITTLPGISWNIFRSSTLALIPIAIVAVILAGPAPAAEDAGEFLISFGKRAVKELKDPSIGDVERERRFRELLNEAVDIPAIGKFILGVHWRRAAAQEQQDFLGVFEDIVVQRFLPMFTCQPDDYSGTGFDIVDVQRDQKNHQTVFVSAQVIREQGAPVRLKWRLRERDKQFKILDISAEGLSMVLTLRQEYNSTINRSGSVDGLVQLLREKIDADAFVLKSTKCDE